MSGDTADRISAAVRRREALVAGLRDTDAWRWVHGGDDGCPGFTLDQLGQVLLVEQHRPDVDGNDFAAAVSRVFPGMPVFIKQRWEKDRSGARQVAGEPAAAAFDVTEAGLRYGVDLDRGEHVGFFLDGRAARAFVRARAEGRRVLNLFAYTGAFGVAAAAGGARSTVNIDNKESALREAAQNYRRNGLAADARTFFRCDVLYYLKRAAGQKGRFDLIIVDPPPAFRRHRMADFEADRHLDRLLTACMAIAEEKGTILAGLNSPRGDWSLLDDMIDRAAALSGRTVHRLPRVEADGDFPGCTDRPVARFQPFEII